MIASLVEPLGIEQQPIHVEDDGGGRSGQRQGDFPLIHSFVALAREYGGGKYPAGVIRS